MSTAHATARRNELQPRPADDPRSPSCVYASPGSGNHVLLRRDDRPLLEIQRRGLQRQVVPRALLVLRQVRPADNLARVGRDAAHDRHQRGLGHVAGLVQRLALANALDQVAMLLDVGAALLFELGHGDLLAHELAVAPDRALRAEELLADLVIAALDLPAHAVHDHVVAVVQIDAEEVVLVAALPAGPPAKAQGLHRRPADEPVGHIQIVDVLLHNVVAGHHAEPVPVADQVLRVALAGRPARSSARPAAPPDPPRLDLADRALGERVGVLKVLGLVSSLRAGDDGQALLLGQLARPR